MQYIIPNFDEFLESGKRDCEDFLVNDDWYEWYDDGCPYDHSGDVQLVKSKFDFVDNIYDHREFIFGELAVIYLGDWEPTFESGRGKHYRRLDEAIRDWIQEDCENAFIEANMIGIDKENPVNYQLIEDLYEFLYDSSEYYDMHKKIDELIQSFTQERILHLLQEAESSKVDT